MLHAEERLLYLWETPHTLWGWLSTVDHKQIGKRYIVTAFLFLAVGGIEALIMRLQLAAPSQGVLPPETYNQVFTMHGVTMIFWYAQPILSGFGNYLVPLMLGARDMAFPRAGRQESVECRRPRRCSPATLMTGRHGGRCSWCRTTRHVPRDLPAARVRTPAVPCAAPTMSARSRTSDTPDVRLSLRSVPTGEAPGSRL